MVITTRAQREALKRKFDQGPIYSGGAGASQVAARRGWTCTNSTEHGWVWTHIDRKSMYHDAADIVAEFNLDTPLTYREFRKTVQPGSDCIMVPWCGMWLGIEKDGYTHS